MNARRVLSADRRVCLLNSIGAFETGKFHEFEKNFLIKNFSIQHAAFDFRTSLTFFMFDTCFNPIPKPSSLVSWSQIRLLNSIAVFEAVRSYQLKKSNLTAD